LQRRLIESAIALVRPGGELIFSVCTLSRAESLDIDEWLRADHPELVALEAPGAAWTPLGRGAILLPQSAGTDGMYVLRLRVPDDNHGADSAP
jgi:16S rRNA (cytosine967-C5)-methyltransferase